MTAPDPLTHIYGNFEYILRSAGQQMAPEKTEVCAQYTRCLTGIPHPFGNMIIAGRQNEQEFVSMLDELESWTAANEAPVCLNTFPGIGLEGSSEILQSREWLLMENLPGMWMEIPDGYEIGPIADGAELRHANDQQGLLAVTQALAEGFPILWEASEFFMKGIHLAGEATNGDLANFLITIDGKPAACSSVCIQDGIAGIYCVATLEEFRGKGLGTAVTKACIEYAGKRGASHALLHASEMGFGVYSRIGFQEICRIPVYGYGF
ncbi:MAG: GNAT family N-acetyltransferase [Puniceicoccaceae bacterium]